MFIHKAEEEALGIDQKATERYRKDNQIPDSDQFAMIMPRGKRGTMSTIYLINIIQSHLKLLYNFKWFISHTSQPIFADTSNNFILILAVFGDLLEK